MSLFKVLSERQRVERDFFNSYAYIVLKNKYNPDIDTAFSELAFDNQFVVGLLGEIQGKNILDLGCGVGEQAIYFGKRGARVVAVDISDGLLEIARDIVQNEKMEDRISVENMKAEDLKFPENYFDIVYGREVLHHVDVKKSISEIKKVLKPEGLVIFIEPLSGNPFIWLYRKIAEKFRTPTEKPLSKKDFRIISNEFPNIKRKNFYLFSLLVFGIYYIYKRFITRGSDLHYWMKDIEKGKEFRRMFIFFQFIDKITLKIFPFLNTFCWITVIWCRNQK